MNNGIFEPVTKPNSLAVDKFNGNAVINFSGYVSQYDGEVIRYASQAYKHLIKDGLVRTFPEFAAIIGIYYDKTNPQNGEVIRVLNKYEEPINFTEAYLAEQSQ